MIWSHYSDTPFHRGDLALLTPGEPGAPWSLEQVFTRGHTEIVRCALWDESVSILIVSVYIVIKIPFSMSLWKHRAEFCLLGAKTLN